nr:hypothetical transcript [Hymenolepis microstoma]CUU99521.1 hypothetical transcript [Hymenolepis microstoma]
MSTLVLYQVADVTRESCNRFRTIEMKDGQDLILIGRMDNRQHYYRQIESFVSRRTISRLHAFIERINDNFYISDLSKCGTYVNHRRIDKKFKLKPHDLVYFGHPSGMEINPGEPISQYFWDLKYVVMIGLSSDKEDQDSGVWHKITECSTDTSEFEP